MIWLFPFFLYEWLLPSSTPSPSPPPTSPCGAKLRALACYRRQRREEGAHLNCYYTTPDDTTNYDGTKFHQTHCSLQMKGSGYATKEQRIVRQSTYLATYSLVFLIGVTDTIYKRWDVGIGGKRERVLQTSRGNKVSPILLCRPPLIADNVVLRGNFVNGTFFVMFYSTNVMVISPTDLWEQNIFFKLSVVLGM